MKRYHPIISIILGIIITVILINFLPNNIPLSYILAIPIFILGGFTATYLSRINKTIIGLYEGIIYSIGYLPTILIYKNFLTPYLALYLVLIPILGLIGGFIGKVLRSRLDNENNEL